MVSRGEVWLATPDPTIGSEIQKTRPWLIVSPPEIHEELRTVIAVPLTNGGRSARYRIEVRFGNREGLILLDQIRALDRQRLIRLLGTVNADALAATFSRTREMFTD